MWATLRLWQKCVRVDHQVLRTLAVSATPSPQQQQQGSEVVVAERQGQRGLVVVRGAEGAAFLQGLLTNDVNHLQEGGRGSLYAMVLNVQGRVEHDLIVYQGRDGQELLLECDAGRAERLARHLRLYRVRRRLDILPVEDQEVWCVFNPRPPDHMARVDPESLYTNPLGAQDEAGSLVVACPDALVTRDPRISYLGHRLILPAGMSADQAVSGAQVAEGQDGQAFQLLRYWLGVGEGPGELPPGKCLPLEANLDYLHGVSFHKGCYVGQELTARTFHTGVIRKRYLPLSFPCGPPPPLPPDATIINEQGKAVGKVRGVMGNRGLGLLRVEEALAASTLTVEGLAVHTCRPDWWPLVASKDRMNL